MRSVLLAGSQNAWLRDQATHYPFVRRSVSRFMPGETMDAAIDAARGLQQRGIESVLTHLGENVVEVGEADAVAAHYREVLDRVRAFGVDAQISVKPTQLGLDLDLETCFRNLSALVQHAERLGNFVWIDMESTKYVDLTLELFRRARAMSPRVGVCLQAYLRRTYNDLESLLPLGPAIRLVKGAYKEPPPIAYAGKRKVDENFFDLASRLLEDDAQRAGAMVAIGTHDEELVERLLREAERRGVPPARRNAPPGSSPGASGATDGRVGPPGFSPRAPGATDGRVGPPGSSPRAPGATDGRVGPPGFSPGASGPHADPSARAGGYEFEMLYGIQRGLQARLVQQHQPLRVLISYGEYWFPWYMRRLAERPANVWFVARSLMER